MSGWTVLGNVAAIGVDVFHGGTPAFAPADGSLQARFGTTGGVDIALIDQATGNVGFTGLGFTTGSMLYQDYTVEAPGAPHTFDFSFVTAQPDTVPGDAAFVSIQNLTTGFGVASFIGNTLFPMNPDTGSGSIFRFIENTVTIPFGLPGNFRLGFGVINRSESTGAGESALYLDSVPAPTAVPEPMSLTLLGIGLLGLAARRRRRS